MRLKKIGSINLVLLGILLAGLIGNQLDAAVAAHIVKFNAQLFSRKGNLGDIVANLKLSKENTPGGTNYPMTFKWTSSINGVHTYSASVSIPVTDQNYYLLHGDFTYGGKFYVFSEGMSFAPNLSSVPIFPCLAPQDGVVTVNSLPMPSPTSSH